MYEILNNVKIKLDSRVRLDIVSFATENSQIEIVD